MPMPRQLHEECQSGRSSSTVSPHGKTKITTKGSRDPILKPDNPNTRLRSVVSDTISEQGKTKKTHGARPPFCTPATDLICPPPPTHHAEPDPESVSTLRREREQEIWSSTAQICLRGLGQPDPWEETVVVGVRSAGFRFERGGVPNPLLSLGHGKERVFSSSLSDDAYCTGVHATEHRLGFPRAGRQPQSQVISAHLMLSTGGWSVCPSMLTPEAMKDHGGHPAPTQ